VAVAFFYSTSIPVRPPSALHNIVDATQALPGHRKPNATKKYLHVPEQSGHEVDSALDILSKDPLQPPNA